VHRPYSGGSNIAYIIDHTGRLHFKENWTRKPHLRRELHGMSYDPGRRRGNRITDGFFEGSAQR